jgi:hypothetical protein
MNPEERETMEFEGSLIEFVKAAFPDVSRF